MAKRLKYILGIILCAVFGSIALVFLAAESSGKDAVQVDTIFAMFAVWMLFGVYRGCIHLFRKERKSIYPTFYGVKYNIVLVPGKKVVADFFNPCKMEFHTVGEIFVSCTLWICMMYFSPKFTVYFWISVSLVVALKGWILLRMLKLNKLQNKVGRDMLQEAGDSVVSRYDVTEQLIFSVGSSPNAVVDPIRPYVDVLGTDRDYKRDLSQFTTEQGHILAVGWYIAEVYGNGHYEFFTGPYGKVYPDAIEGLKAIGAARYAEILECAASEFDGLTDPVLDLDKRIEAIDRLDLDFEDANLAIYSLDEYGEEIQALQMAYIRSHAGAFLFTNPLRSYSE